MINIVTKLKKSGLTGRGGGCFPAGLKWELVKDNTLIIEIPKLTIDEIPCLHAWTLKIEFEE